MPGPRDAPVLIDQEGGRVQRLRPAALAGLSPGAVFGALWGIDRDLGLEAARLGARRSRPTSRPRHHGGLPAAGGRAVAGADAVIGDRAYGTRR